MDLMNRILTNVIVVILTFGSLLTFPVHLPWMVFMWLTLALLAFANSKPMWPWLLVCVVIISSKRPGFTIEFWVLVFAFAAIGVIEWRFRRKHDNNSPGLKPFGIYAVLLIVAATFFAAMRWFGANTSEEIVSDGRPVACLGDSLTDFGYPQELEKLISVPVCDFGVNGITTDDGINMIPEILEADPQLVVIELGGNDYNAERKTRKATRANLVQLIDAFREREIAVILIEIPRGFISDPYDGLERELAAKYDLQLIDDSIIRSFVFNSSIMPPGIWRNPAKRYSNDGLHPNELGNKQLALVVNQALIRVFGESIDRNQALSAFE